MNVFRSQGLKNTIYGLLVVAIGLVFLIQFRQQPTAARGRAVGTDCVAEVRGECLSARDFATVRALVGRRDEAEVEKRFQLKKRAIDGLVERALLVQDATRLGLAVADDDLNASLTAGHALVSLPAATPSSVLAQLGLTPVDRPTIVLPVKGANGQFDRTTYKKSLRMYVGRGEQEFREMQQQELLAARVRDLVRARVRVSDDEAFINYEREHATASIRYARLSRTWFGKHAVPTTDAAIDAWAGTHKDELDKAWESRKAQYTPECVRVHELVVTVAQTATDEERSAARKRAEDARARLTKKGAFEQVAREVSDDATLPAGGDLGCAGAARLDKPVEAAIAALKDGEVSAVEEGEKGFFIVKRDVTLREAAAETEGRRDVARTMMTSVEGDTKAAAAAKQLRDAVAAGTPFEAALADVLAPYPHAAVPTKAAASSAARGADASAPASKGADETPRVVEAKEFSADGSPISGVAPGVDAAGLAFTLQKAGDVPADLVKLDDGYAVLQLIDKKLVTREAFLGEREKAKAALLASKQQSALAAYVARLRDAAKADVKVNQAYLKEEKTQAPPDADGEP